MATGFYLKDKSKKTSPVFIIVRYAGNRYKKTSGISVEVKFWNAESQICRENKNYPHAPSINIKLRQLKLACDKVCDEMTARLQTFSADEYWDKVDKLLYGDSGKNEVSFTEYMLRYAQLREKVDKRNTYKQYFTVYNKILEFEKRYRVKLQFKDINLKFYHRLQMFLKENGYSDNYFGMIIKVIKKVYRDARDVDGLHNLTETEKQGFVTIQKSSPSIYLTLEELEKIFRVEFTPELIVATYPEWATLPQHKMQWKVETLNTIRNKFLIGAYTGLRVSDYNHLKKENIDGNFIRVTTKKTGTTVVIPIHPNLRKILESDFNMSATISEQKINMHIKEIARYAGITQKVEGSKLVNGRVEIGYWDKCDLVTTHTARRSAATNMFKAGIPSLSIMFITGHKTEKAFLKYIKISQEENAELMAKNPFFQGTQD